VVVTWDLTEPFGGLLDFNWDKTINRFQAVLHRDGSIEMSYKELEAKDAIVGLYPVLAGKTRLLATGMRSSDVHFSAVTRKDGPFAVVYESFHYLAPPKPQDLSCTIIQALGDKFDFLAYYSDFRIDSQEASPPSEGPVGSTVTGIGQPGTYPNTYCTQGRFQLELAQPVYVDANEMQEAPPSGAPVGGPHDITFYVKQLAKASPNGPLPYNYAIGHLGHEVGHRWAAYVSAKVKGETTPLGPWPHWGQGLHALVAFPYSLPTEASTMGGGAWQDNLDGTYTLRRDGFFVPATGYSHLDLYLMGLISAAEVPDFFLLKNLVPVGRDGGGHPVFKADRTKVTIADVIALEGPRLPDADHSQREFNTGIVVVVEHGHSPTRNLTDRADGIRRRWIDYWGTTTGHRASMTATPRRAGSCSICGGRRAAERWSDRRRPRALRSVSATGSIRSRPIGCHGAQIYLDGARPAARPAAPSATAARAAGRSERRRDETDPLDPALHRPDRLPGDPEPRSCDPRARRHGSARGSGRVTAGTAGTGCRRRRLCPRPGALRRQGLPDGELPAAGAADPVLPLPGGLRLVRPPHLPLLPFRWRRLLPIAGAMPADPVAKARPRRPETSLSI